MFNKLQNKDYPMKTNLADILIPAQMKPAQVQTQLNQAATYCRQVLQQGKDIFGMDIVIDPLMPPDTIGIRPKKV